MDHQKASPIKIPEVKIPNRSAAAVPCTSAAIDMTKNVYPDANEGFSDIYKSPGGVTWIRTDKCTLTSTNLKRKRSSVQKIKKYRQRLSLQLIPDDPDIHDMMAYISKSKHEQMEDTCKNFDPLKDNDENVFCGNKWILSENFKDVASSIEEEASDFNPLQIYLKESMKVTHEQQDELKDEITIKTKELKLDDDIDSSNKIKCVSTQTLYTECSCPLSQTNVIQSNNVSQPGRDFGNYLTSTMDSPRSQDIAMFSKPSLEVKSEQNAVGNQTWFPPSPTSSFEEYETENSIQQSSQSISQRAPKHSEVFEDAENNSADTPSVLMQPKESLTVKAIPPDSTKNLKSDIGLVIITNKLEESNVDSRENNILIQQSSSLLESTNATKERVHAEKKKGHPSKKRKSLDDDVCSLNTISKAMKVDSKDSGSLKINIRPITLEIIQYNDEESQFGWPEGLNTENTLTGSEENVEIESTRRVTRSSTRQVKIRKTLPKQQVRHTPMGLPKPNRLKKKKFSVEEIYLNKNYVTPTEKSWETIFEFPKEEKSGSTVFTEKRKKKRVCQFSLDPSCRKPLDKRKQTRKKIKFFPKKVLKRKDLDEVLENKLSELKCSLNFI